MSVLKCPQCGSKDLATAGERVECGGCGHGHPVIWGEVPDFSPAPGFKDTWGFPADPVYPEAGV